MMIASLLLSASLAASALPSGTCRQMIRSRAAGAEVAEADTAIAACPPEPAPPGLSYDAATGTVRARRDLAIGEVLSHAWFPPHPAVVAGERVMISARIRHVALSRHAVALQSAAAGKHFFAKLDDGSIIAAPPMAMDERR